MGVGLWPETEPTLVPDEVFEERDTVTAHTEYQTDPVSWAVDKLGIARESIEWSLNPGYDTHAWDGDVDPLAAMFNGLRDWQDVAVESGTGIGKSYGAAILILWFLACWEDAQVYTFALTEDQLTKYIWKNVTELWPAFSRHFPAAKYTELSIRMRGGIDETWQASGRPVQIRAGEAVASRAQGMHGEDMLLVYEEAAAMAWAIVEAGRNTCTRPHNLRLFIGNPNNRLDSLHRASQQPGVKAVRASALDHPNVVSGNPDTVLGTISRQKLDLRLEEYGEDSPVYQSRVRGVSPEQASDALIRHEWLVAADLRYRMLAAAGQVPKQITGKGVDVANSEHGDRSCIVDFASHVVVRVEADRCPDANVLGRRVKMEMEAAGLPPLRVGVDATGVGAGTVNELRRLGATVQALHNGGAPMPGIERGEDGKPFEWAVDVNKFRNFRDQSYWQLREDLRHGVIDMSRDDGLWEELLAPTFVDDPKTIIEPKDEIRQRLGRSPDKADALVMANWVRKRILPKPSSAPAGKHPHRAYPITVKDGKLVPVKRPPTTVAELADWAESRARRQHSNPERRRPTRRSYD